MIKRPKNTDTEHDILKMQNEFLAEKEKNQQFQPAAKVVRLNEDAKKSDGKKISQFAKKRGLDVVEKQTAPKGSVLFGEIVEKRVEEETIQSQTEFDPLEADTGFPKVEKLLTSCSYVDTSKKSIFARTMESKKLKNPVDVKKTSMDLDDANLPESSLNLDDYFNREIHEANLEKLKGMTEKEIIQERQELFNMLDPKIIEFLKSRKKGNMSSSITPVNMDNHFESKILTKDVEILQDPNAHKWLNFDVVEPEKLEWMKNIPETMSKLKPGEEYEARFDWKGFLLPYSSDREMTDNNRELFLHGDDPHRPGYSLQELFRLSRSTVIQQRISALNSIAGILNIYNQGYYDRVLDLPLTKIFFLLRFALDENLIAMLDSSAQAMATLFYNDVDETVLDIIFEASHSLPQPFLKVIDSGLGNNSLENTMDNLSITSGGNGVPFKSNIDEETMNEISSMNDFHLAETDLIECLLRTNILERIRYIVQTIRPETSTITALLKILIRVARTSPECVQRILLTPNLMQTLIENFLPRISSVKQIGSKIQFFNRPQHLLLKLMRVIGLSGTRFFIEIRQLNIEDAIRSYAFVQEDLNENVIQLQIEVFRFLKLWAIYNNTDGFIKSIQPALRFFLEWHYQFLDFHQGGHFLIRQHAASIISLIGLANHIDFLNLFSPVFVRCFNKWCDISQKQPDGGIKEFSQSILLTSCVETSKLLLDTGNGDFKFLENLMSGKQFRKYTENLCKTSILLSYALDRSKNHPPLPNFGSVAFTDETNSSPYLIFSKNYNFVFLNSLIEIYPNQLLTNVADIIINYLTNFRNNDIKLSPNWFLKFELKFIVNCLKNHKKFNRKDLLFQVAYKLINHLSGIYFDDINFIYENILFHSEFYGECESDELEICKRNYLELLTDSISEQMATSIMNWTEIVIPSYWPYLPLLILYQTSQNPQIVNATQMIDEGRLIRMSLMYTRFLEGKIANFLKPIDHLVYIMLPYFSTDSKFLVDDIKEMIGHRRNILNGLTFDFEAKFMGDKMSFENFYISFLEQFQSMSYGDEIFSSLVIIPLQQKYNVKWRKRVWSEHVAVLRFISCDENGLIGTFDDYINPPETDVSLLKCYNQALKTNVLRIGSIPYKIAEFHVKQYMSKITK